MSFGMMNQSWKIEPSPVVDLLAAAVGLNPDEFPEDNSRIDNRPEADEAESVDNSSMAKFVDTAAAVNQTIQDMSELRQAEYRAGFTASQAEQAEQAEQTAAAAEAYRAGLEAEHLEAVDVQEAEAVEPVQRACFQANRRELLDAISQAGGAINRNRFHKPGTTSVLMSVNGTVEFSATDMEQSVRLNRDFDRSGDASILIDAKRISAALKLSKAPIVDVDIIGDQVTIGPSTIPAACDLADFPAAGWSFAPSEVRAEFWIDGPKFAAAVKRTEFCTDSDCSRYAFGGILLEANSDGARLVATDSHRLSIVELGRPDRFEAVDSAMKPAGNLSVFSAVVPVATMERVAKAVGKSATRTVHVIAHESAPVYNDTPVPGIDKAGKPTEEKHKPDSPAAVLQVTFRVVTSDGVQEFTTKPIDGRFPDFRKIIPVSCNLEFRCEAGSLLEACKLALSVRTDEIRGADFRFSGDTLEITAQTEAGKIKTAVLGAPIPDEGMNLLATFDARYIAEFLETMPRGERIAWRLIDHESAAVIRSQDDGLTTYVFMPLTRD